MKKLFLNKEGAIYSPKILPVSILNIGAGRSLPIDHFFGSFLVNIDRDYNLDSNINEIEKFHGLFNSSKDDYSHSNLMFRHKCDIFEFLETYYNKFDLLIIYRFLEHVSFTEVLYFIYLLSQIINEDGLVDIIVPDYYRLAEMIVYDNTKNPCFEQNNILLTTELLNEPNDPHASIWTYERLIHFFELENRFTVENIIKNFKYDNRDIYLRAIIRRV